MTNCSHVIRKENVLWQTGIQCLALTTSPQGAQAQLL